MQMYMSGINDGATYQMMVEAEISAILVDPKDLKNVPDSWQGKLAIDSGAYRAFKKGEVLDPEKYKAWLSELARPFDFAIAPDVIGDAEATWQNWQACKSSELTPVWQWGAPREHLDTYLADASLVAIGGLVPLMRAKDEAMLTELTALCAEHPGRFHVLGINWLKAIEAVRHTAASGDTSKMLDGGRYGHVIFVNTKTGRLSQAPAKVISEYASFSRAERIIYSAKSLQVFSNPTP